MNLIVGHMMGDYLFQNGWMALNKTNKNLPCFVHCLIYSLCILFVTGWCDWRILVVFLTHFLLDRFRLARYWRIFMGDKDPQFAYIILSDNTIHLIILMLLSWV